MNGEIFRSRPRPRVGRNDSGGSGEGLRAGEGHGHDEAQQTAATVRRSRRRRRLHGSAGMGAGRDPGPFPGEEARGKIATGLLACTYDWKPNPRDNPGLIRTVSRGTNPRLARLNMDLQVTGVEIVQFQQNDYQTKMSRITFAAFYKILTT
uniref:Uncharacterized protein n=1 Tax=Leersia perrieri TaxID=77586 RepID=A0A0D9WDY0_9ORYZ